ncbi:universal stress protein [Ferrimonas kyonanensis]|uniref:universal stress protein n=1 Tax=Ferrimonas kyonanensis TaxID=364763 RepID=UPI0003FC2634|nr:universal stress protein [Ferrimonas kyonanensis]
MSVYSKVLIPLDFHGDNEWIVAKGMKVAADHGAELFLLHVDETLAERYLFESASFSGHLKGFKQEICQESQQRMRALAKDMQLDDDHVLVREGKAAKAIEATVTELGIDLVVMGTHGHSGLQRLLGSTANRVLHSVDCDVLTVRSKE